jgi:hypothetical protein
LSGRKASSEDSYSRPDLEWKVTVDVAEMPEFDRFLVEASPDCTEPDLEFSVDPSYAYLRSGDTGDKSEFSSRLDCGGVDMLCPL